MKQPSLKPGRPSLGPAKRVRLSMTLKPDLVERLEKTASRTGISSSRMVETLLEEGLQKRAYSVSLWQTRLGVDIENIRALCKALRLKRLSLFGSALTERFNNESDVDLLIEFLPGEVETLFDRGRIQMDFEDLLGRPVDLAELRLIENPLKRQEILSNLVELYAA
jgi:predicted nucleotidyltransferase